MRNAIAHADYTLTAEGRMRLRRNGGHVRIILWNEFYAPLCPGLISLTIILQIIDEYSRSYHPPKTIKSRISEVEPLTDYALH